MKIGTHLSEETKKKIGTANLKWVDPKVLKTITSELAYVLGTIKGDGHVGKYTTSLEVTDEDFALYFKKNVESWCSLRAKFSVRASENKKYKKRYVVWLCSKIVCDFLKSFDLDRIKNSGSKKIKSNFLRGFFDSEGTVNKQGKIVSCSNRDEELMQFVQSLLSDLEVESSFKTTYIEKYKKNHFHLFICGKRNILLYNKKVGFSIGRKQSRLKKGVQSYLSLEQLRFIRSLPNDQRKTWKKLWRMKNG